MRTTLRIDDDLLRQLKDQAHREGVRLTELVNRLIRRGLDLSRRSNRDQVEAYREKTYAMGQPAVNLDKALDLAAELEDAETLDKLTRRK